MDQTKEEHITNYKGTSYQLQINILPITVEPLCVVRYLMELNKLDNSYLVIKSVFFK